VEHPPRLTSVVLVFSTRLIQMLLEGDWQRVGLALFSNTAYTIVA
jgi:hypothetical protein